MLISRCLLVALFVMLSPITSLAQSVLPTDDEAPVTAAPADEDLTPDAVRDMVSRLSDQEVRDLLLQRLHAVAEENGASCRGGKLHRLLAYGCSRDWLGGG